MKRKYFHFLFLLTGIVAVLIAQSVSNNANILSAYATGDKKYKYDDYKEKKSYDKGYDYKKQTSQYQQKEYDRESYDGGYGNDDRYGYEYNKDYYPSDDKQGH